MIGHAIHILGISGSLRARSSNTELLRAASLMAPSGVCVTLFSGLDALPHFNPDLDGEGGVPPPRIRDFRRRIRRADALLICSPEYAHGVPGALKNALDWLVSTPDVVYKPVGLLNASPRSTHAQASLAETLRTGDNGTYLALDPQTAEQLALAVAREAEGAEMKGIEPVFVCATQLRPSVRRLLHAAAPRLPVLAYTELGAQLELALVNLAMEQAAAAGWDAARTHHGRAPRPAAAMPPDPRKPAAPPMT